MQRGWMQHHIFKDEPFSDREAWVWLIENAAWYAHTYRYKNDMITLQIGDVPTSYRNLIKTWRWSQGRIKNFLKILQKEKLITKKTDTGFLIITLCEYDQFRFKGKKPDTPVDTPTDTVPDTPTDTLTDTRADTYLIIDNKGNKERDARAGDFKNLKLEGEFMKFLTDKQVPENRGLGYWEMFKIHFESLIEIQNLSEPKEGWLAVWKKWVLRELSKFINTSIPAAVESMTLQEKLIHKVGIASWRQSRGMFITSEDLACLQKWVANHGKVTWVNYRDWKNQQTEIDKNQDFKIPLANHN